MSRCHSDIIKSCSGDSPIWYDWSKMMKNDVFHPKVTWMNIMDSNVLLLSRDLTIQEWWIKLISVVLQPLSTNTFHSIHAQESSGVFKIEFPIFYCANWVYPSQAVRQNRVGKNTRKHWSRAARQNGCSKKLTKNSKISMTMEYTFWKVAGF